MVALPEEFIKATREVMGDELFSRYLASFDQEPPVSIRLNPHFSLFTFPSSLSTLPSSIKKVPWSSHGYYLPHRPNFTFDPLFHAGCYYVQEAASMFLEAILQQYLPQHPVTMLDLCAAPGGKSTLARAVLPGGSVLYANEPIRNRASILLENITKWGYPDCYVTNNYPRDYARAGIQFDIILCDVPCSGEGMFRKDPATIGEWSPQNVERCWRLQRDIVSDAWKCLRPGGLLIYSTCTFNVKENEENVRWLLSEYEADLLPVQTQPEWHITGSLLPGFVAPVYRFIPGITQSEGLFMCAIRKGLASPSPKGKENKKVLSILQPPLSNNLTGEEPKVDLTYAQAISYLRGEALILPPDTPLGIITVTFMGQSLGQVKNIGSRANNLYPKEWRIKTTHVPTEYEPVFAPQK